MDRKGNAFRIPNPPSNYSDEAIRFARKKGRGGKDMHRLGFLLGIILVICSIEQWSWAERAYVTDTFKITLRTGPSVENKIISMLNSGEALETLGVEGEWTHVQVIEDGEGPQEGWVLSRYLMTRPPWKILTDNLKKKYEDLDETMAENRNRINEVLQENQVLSEKLRDTTKNLEGIRKQHEELKRGSEEYLELKKSHDSTQTLLNSLRQALQEERRENEKLRSSQENRWFATGAMVLLCGLLLGLMMGRQQKKKKSLYS